MRASSRKGAAARQVASCEPSSTMTACHARKVWACRLARARGRKCDCSKLGIRTLICGAAGILSPRHHP
jgi:hypothetical protein